MSSAPERSLAGELIVRGGLAYGRLHSALWRRVERARGAVGVFLHEALSDAERAELVQRIFSRHHAYGPTDLFPWEVRWFERDLPRAPARLLIGGCGAGRELHALAARGYAVHGLEPSARLAQGARRLLGEGARVWTLRYEDLLDRGDDVRAEAPYDAVICGWGSLAHVLDGAARTRVLEALARMCPSGPILLSFPFLAGARGGPDSRWRAPAERCGRVVRRWRRLPPVATEPEEFLPHAGFVHCFDEAELTALAAQLGRTLCWGERSEVYPHCTLVAGGRASTRASAATGSEQEPHR